MQHECVGVLTLWQCNDVNLEPLTQQHVAGTKRRCQAGAVAVVQEEHGGRVLPKQLGLRLGQRRSKRRDRAFYPGREKAHAVEVAFDQQHALVFANGVLGPVQSVQGRAFLERRRLGRIQILRLTGPDHSPAERDDATLRIVDRKHQSVAKARTRLPALLLHDEQSCLDLA